MGTFNQYYRLLQKEYDEKGNSSAKGAPFEKFVKKFLKTSPVWSSQIKNIWLWEEYPDKWSRDIGIDLVFHDHLGKKWAVQAKCYDPKYNIPKTEIDSFLSASSSKRIDRTLLIATTNLIGKNAKIALEENNTTLFLKKDFENCNYQFPTSLTSQPKLLKQKTIKPKPHQESAIKDVIDGFKKYNRGQLIMACGTGKTFTSIWIDQRLKNNNTLLLVPTLNLIEKSLKDWSLIYNHKIDIICVCSDNTVSRNIERPYEISDLPYPVYNESKDICKFLNGNNKKLIISTYLSADIFEDVFKKSKINQFDLTIFDEAHKCTGDDASKLTLSSLQPKVLKSKKYLFMTATPRESSDQIRKIAEKRNKKIFFMDDKKIYGNRFHELPFGTAIEKKLLNDYKVIIYGITENHIANFIDKRTLVKIKKNLTSADELATTIGFIDSLKKYNLNKLITFHTTKDQARNFTNLIEDTNSIIKSNKKISKKLITNSVTSDEPVFIRMNKINELESIDTKKQVYILTNSRCLTEGVDIPTLDGIAFISPKRSIVDIVQATGRAIRPSKPIGTGYIIVPFFISKDDLDEIDEKKLKSNYSYIFQILSALKEHDNVLSESIDQLRVELGTKKVSIRGKLPKKIVINLPEDLPVEFSDRIVSMIVEETTQDWLEKYSLLKQYVKEFGSVESIGYRTRYQGVFIGQHQRYVIERYLQGTLSEYRIKLYRELNGWTWKHRRESVFDQGYRKCLAYIEKYGHIKPLKTDKPFDGFAIYHYLDDKRIQRRKGKLSDRHFKQIDKFRKYGFKWDYEIDKRTYEDKIEIVRDYIESNKVYCSFCEMYFYPYTFPIDLKYKGGLIISSFVSGLRRKIKEKKIDKKLYDQVKTLPGWFDTIEDTDFNRFYEHVIRFDYKKKPFTSKEQDFLKTFNTNCKCRTREAPNISRFNVGWTFHKYKNKLKDNIDINLSKDHLKKLHSLFKK